MIRRIYHCLNPKLLELCDRALHLDELDSKVKKLFSTQLAQHSRITSFHKGSLVISTTDAVWATELRYIVPELRDKLRKEGLYQLVSIKIVIESSEQKEILQSEIKKTSKISLKTRNNLEIASELCSYPPLKEALLQMAKKNP